MNETTTSKHVELLDCGRLLAALAVLCFHYLYNGIRNGKIVGGEFLSTPSHIAMYGYLGVELFFMISGYVILFSARDRSAREFAVSRLVRILPAFWGAVLLTSCIAQIIGTPGTTVTLREMVSNLLLCPNLFHQKFVDGVYWTLVYEVQFYALVAALLCTPLRSRLSSMALCWPFAIGLARLVGHSHLPFLSPVHAFFAAGAVFAVLRTDKGPFAFASLLLALSLCILDTAGNVADIGSPYQRSPLVIALIIIAMFVFFGLANTQWSLQSSIPGSGWAGRITYPLYLVHAHIGYMTLSRFGTSVAGYAIAFIFALMLAIGLHLSVEVAMRNFWHRAFTKAVSLVPPIFTSANQSESPSLSQ